MTKLKNSVIVEDNNQLSSAYYAAFYSFFGYK